MPGPVPPKDSIVMRKALDKGAVDAKIKQSNDSILPQRGKRMTLADPLLATPSELARVKALMGDSRSASANPLSRSSTRTPAAMAASARAITGAGVAAPSAAGALTARGRTPAQMLPPTHDLTRTWFLNNPYAPPSVSLEPSRVRFQEPEQAPRPAVPIPAAAAPIPVARAAITPAGRSSGAAALPLRAEVPAGGVGLSAAHLEVPRAAAAGAGVAAVGAATAAAINSGWKRSYRSKFPNPSHTSSEQGTAERVALEERAAEQKAAAAQIAAEQRIAAAERKTAAARAAAAERMAAAERAAAAQAEAEERAFVAEERAAAAQAAAAERAAAAEERAAAALAAAEERALVAEQRAATALAAAQPAIAPEPAAASAPEEARAESPNAVVPAPAPPSLLVPALVPTLHAFQAPLAAQPRAASPLPLMGQSRGHEPQEMAAAEAEAAPVQDLDRERGPRPRRPGTVRSLSPTALAQAEEESRLILEQQRLFLNVDARFGQRLPTIESLTPHSLSASDSDNSSSRAPSSGAAAAPAPRPAPEADMRAEPIRIPEAPAPIAAPIADPTLIPAAEAPEARAPNPPTDFNAPELALLMNLRQEAIKAMTSDTRRPDTLKMLVPNYSLLRKLAEDSSFQFMMDAVEKGILVGESKFLRLRLEQLNDFLKEESHKSNPAIRPHGKMLSFEELQKRAEIAYVTRIELSLEKFLRKNHEQSWRWAIDGSLIRVSSMHEAGLSTAMKASLTAFRHALEQAMNRELSVVERALLGRYDPRSEWVLKKRSDPSLYNEAFWNLKSFPGAYRSLAFLPESDVEREREIINHAEATSPIFRRARHRLETRPRTEAAYDSYPDIIRAHRELIADRIAAIRAEVDALRELLRLRSAENLIPLQAADAVATDEVKQSKRALQLIQDELFIKEAIQEHYKTLQILSQNLTHDTNYLRTREDLAAIPSRATSEEYLRWLEEQSLSDIRTSEELRMRMLQDNNVFLDQEFRRFESDLEIATLLFKEDAQDYLQKSGEARESIWRSFERLFKAKLLQRIGPLMNVWASWEPREPNSTDLRTLKRQREALRQEVELKRAMVKKAIAILEAKLASLTTDIARRQRPLKIQIGEQDKIFSECLTERFNIMMGPDAANEQRAYENGKKIQEGEAGAGLEDPARDLRLSHSKSLGTWICHKHPGVRLEKANLLLREAIPPNARDALGNNLLHEALKNPVDEWDERLLEICEGLVAMGVEVDRPNTDRVHPSGLAHTAMGLATQGTAHRIASAIFTLCTRTKAIVESPDYMATLPPSVLGIDGPIAQLRARVEEYDFKLALWEAETNPFKSAWKPKPIIDDLEDLRAQLGLPSPDARMTKARELALLEDWLPRKLSKGDLEKLGVYAIVEALKSHPGAIAGRATIAGAVERYQRTELEAQVGPATRLIQASARFFQARAIALGDEVAVLSGEKVALVATNAGLVATNAAQASTITGLETTITGLETTIATKAATITGLEATNTAQAADISALRAANAAILARLAALGRGAKGVAGNGQGGGAGARAGAGEASASEAEPSSAPAPGCGSR